MMYVMSVERKRPGKCWGEKFTRSNFNLTERSQKWVRFSKKRFVRLCIQILDKKNRLFRGKISVRGRLLRNNTFRIYRWHSTRYCSKPRVIGLTKAASTLWRTSRIKAILLQRKMQEDYKQEHLAYHLTSPWWQV